MIRNKDFTRILCMIFLVLVISPILASAYEDQDENEWRTASGVDVEELIVLGSSILAIALFSLTIIAYNRDKRKKLLYVAVAFFFFAVKDHGCADLAYTLDHCQGPLDNGLHCLEVFCSHFSYDVVFPYGGIDLCYVPYLF